ncbi:L-type lectin-domain containing receptor kinase VII.1-like [Aristolochia californica]|uniref:L-type lectin-domain containing receptor kinase VII.1-like n=1 Tax=Aristolochia californica TaxID=171875 RepID=UPI0035DF6859
MAKYLVLLPLLLVQFVLVPRLSSGVEFVFNGFDDRPSPLLLYADASIRSRHLAVTNDSTVSLGRALYKAKIPTKTSNSSSSASPFFTSFIFAIPPLRNYQPGHGLAFLFAPSPGTLGANQAQHLGLFNRTNDGSPGNHVFAVEFDVFANPEFDDIDGNHVGVDINSLTSVAAHTAGYYPDTDSSAFVNLTLNNGANYQAWIDYANLTVTVSMAPAGVRKPKRPLLSIPLDLADIFFDEMYVGFCAATGMLVEGHKILAWSFSNTNFSAHEALITTNLPSFLPKNKTSFHKSRGFIAGVSVAVVLFVASVLAVTLIWLRISRRKRKERDEEATEEWELEYWPHRISYQDIHYATKGFSEEKLIGIGGNGKVYKGVLSEGTEVAIKCINQGSEEAVREFLSEVSSLGRLKHRNLVSLRGWCKRERGSLMLVYDYMENGSLDKWIFDCSEDMALNWEARVKILRDVASAVLYLHEGWESRVLHRDIKASNVMLDEEMNGRLGDFGLARMQRHSHLASTTRVVGTVGYMAPEVLVSGKAGPKSDIFGFGVLILEVACGRRPVEEGKPPLVEWVWGLMEKDELTQVLDERLRRCGSFSEDEVEWVIRLGLLCTYPDPEARPDMRTVVRAMEGPTRGEKYVDKLVEGMEASLLEKVKVKDRTTWSKYYGSRKRAHPTFEELRESLSSSVSLSSSDVIQEGR